MPCGLHKQGEGTGGFPFKNPPSVLIAVCAQALFKFPNMIDCQPPQKLPEHPAQIAAVEQQHSKPLVLIVEDDYDTRYMMTTLLKMWDYSVSEATDGAQALTLARQNRPDLVLLDLTLSPEMDGLETMRRMRRTAGLENVPFVFLTGHGQSAIREEVLALGGSDFLVKPLDLGKLETALNKHLKKKSRDNRSLFKGIY
jgi:CheY-like chemotaxis protein